ncbi:MAG: citrate synthase [Bacteroidia bacterium]|nr:citrate synthase [Bacteroidia bacterium]MDW8158561.1 citrate synthase [Bacteroidia bacterium]
MSEKKAQLILEDQTYELPIIVGTENEKAIDIRNLRDETGYITLDSGYKNTGATISTITFLDGEEGILRYRGYPIEQLAEQSTFLEVAYLLIYGKLPTKDELSNFELRIKQNSLIHEDNKKFFDGFPQHAHPMGMLASSICSMSAFFPESLDPNRPPELVDHSIVRLLGKMPTFIAWTYKKRIGEPYVYPRYDLDYISNFLNMMFSTPMEEYHIDPVVVDALDKLMILHADHEQNCSTSTVRLVGSSQANLYAAISSGICALWGPLHGGANQEVIVMLERIKEDGGNIQKWIDKAKDKNDPFRLMGFGHRVYKNFDPRAKIIKAACDKVLSKLGIYDPVLDIAKKLEEVALNDPYFIERKLYPNVDFYSGIILRAIGIPVDKFTVMFAFGRLPGWIAQWKEMRENREPIGRPRQVYMGPTKRDFVPIAKREN